MKIILALFVFLISSSVFSVEAELLQDCEKQDLVACEKLGAYYLSQSDWAKSLMLGEALCGRDMGTGCLFAGTSLIAQGKLKEAQHFLNQGCDKFEPLSCRSMARMMDKVGEKALANMYFKRACHYGMKDICEDLKNSHSWFSPSAMSLIQKMKTDCEDTKSKACLIHLATINSCVLPLIKLDCQLLSGYLSIFFRAKLLQSEARASLLLLHTAQKNLKQSEAASYSYDLEKVFKDFSPMEKYQYVVGFMKSCGSHKKTKTNMRELFPKAYKQIGPRTTANILAYFKKGSKDDCYEAKSGYEAFAVGNLDPMDPSRIDVWKIDQDEKVELVVDGLPLP